MDTPPQDRGTELQKKIKKLQDEYMLLEEAEERFNKLVIVLG